MDKQYQSLAEFYPYYLEEHSDRTCRRLHFLGSSAGLVCVVAALVTFNPLYLLLGLVIGYGCAWVGHFFFEHNKPATFKYPWLSFRSDWLMYKDMWTGKIPF